MMTKEDNSFVSNDRQYEVNKRMADDEMIKRLAQLKREVLDVGHELLKSGLNERAGLLGKKLDYDLYLKLYSIYVNGFVSALQELYAIRERQIVTELLYQNKEL